MTDHPVPTIDEAEAACERARQRLGLLKTNIRAREARASPGSAAQQSLENARRSQESLGSILSRWETSLSTTGDQNRVQEALNSIGRQHGATGAVVKLSDHRPSAGHPRSRSSKTASTLTSEQIGKLLLEMDALVKHRSETPEERTLRLKAYLGRLSDLDGRAVTLAIKDWPNHHEWWPSWAELKREIDGWI